MNFPVTSHKQQRGIVIVIALVMLLGMTILSVTSMTNSTLEERMSANLRDREIALQAAEAALRYGERIAPGYNKTQFTETCENGLCNFDLQDTTINHYKYWSPNADFTTDVWANNTPATHIVYDASIAIAEIDSTSTRPKLIIEYMGKQIQDLSAGAQASDPPVFRITAMGYGQSSTTRVMLQSTFIPN